ncbi:MAG: cell division protein ZapB [Vicinamibacterales bacterium]
MVKQASALEVDFEPIDRLEEKVTLLVTTVSRLRAEQAQAAEENTRLAQEVATLQARLADTQITTTEIAALREERDVIRGRVSDMLQQLDQLAV